MDKYTGKKLDGRYEIHEMIGVGGMAMVYRAHDVIDDREVAIKILKDEFLGNAEFIRRFKNESKAIAVLSHPNIVKVYDVSFGDMIQYIVMEYIDGITLKEYIANNGVIDWREAVHFTTQILTALQHAHEKGIIHRDIKPQNIMLLEDGTIKVTDFGIARFSNTETKTMTDKAIGSVHYIAPEQAKGETTDCKSDIYSIGVMLYEMLAGKLPFEAENAVSVAIMQLQSDPKPPREINPSIPVGLEEITIKAMQKDPAKRYNSAAEMLSDLLKFRKNPSINFNYSYSSVPTVKPTVHTVNKINESDYGKDDWDDYSEDTDEKKSNPMVQVVVGAVSAFICVCLVFVVLAIFKGFSDNSTTDVEVPNLIGLNFSDVNKDKTTYNFRWDVTNTYDKDKPLDIIISQDPEPSVKKIKEGSTISIVVNSEETTINLPNIDGRRKDEAVQKIKAVNLIPEVLMVLDNQTAEGYVKQTYPLAGSKITIGSSVKIYISKKAGESKIEIPNLVGLTLSEAQTKLSEAGLNYNGYTYMESTVSKDKVVAQNPLRGAKVNKGTNVSVILSEGPPRNITLSQRVDLPKDVSSSVKFEVFIDGEVDDSYTKSIVPKYAKEYTLSLKRLNTVGSVQVAVALNDQTYRVYKFDFANETVTTLESYEFLLDTDTETDTETDTDSNEDTDSYGSSSDDDYTDTDSSDYDWTDDDYTDTDSDYYVPVSSDPENGTSSGDMSSNTYSDPEGYY